MTNQDKSQVDVVYWYSSNVSGRVLFARREDADYEAKRIISIYDSKNWGELRANLPPGERIRMFELFGVGGLNSDNVHLDDIEDELSVSDYPEWLRHCSFFWFPEVLVKKYGIEKPSTSYDRYLLDLPADRAGEIIEDLTELGYTVNEPSLQHRYARVLVEERRKSRPRSELHLLPTLCRAFSD